MNDRQLFSDVAMALVNADGSVKVTSQPGGSTNPQARGCTVSKPAQTTGQYDITLNVNAISGVADGLVLADLGAIVTPINALPLSYSVENISNTVKRIHFGNPAASGAAVDTDFVVIINRPTDT